MFQMIIRDVEHVHAGFLCQLKKFGSNQPLHGDDCVCVDTPILHDDTQNLKGVLVFADQFFRCKEADIKLS